MKTDLIDIKAIKAIVLSFILILGFHSLSAQTKKQEKDKAKALEVQKLIDSKRFRFKVQFIQPMRGGSINATSEYDIRVKNDTLVCYLPYFGRAYTAPMDPTESGLNFTTTEFEYKAEKKKKGGHELSIIPKNRQDYARQFLLTVSEAGYGTLQVTANNREPISYTGYIEPLK